MGQPTQEGCPSGLSSRRRMASSVRALVTGGGGFLGARLVRELLRRGDEVRVLDVARGVLASEGHSGPEFVGLGGGELYGGMADEGLVAQAVQDVDVIHHLAISWFGWRERPPLPDLYDANIRGTLNLLEAARVEGVKHFLFASSEAVYGRTSSPAVDEETVCRPELWGGGPGPAYGILKLATEKLCLMYHHRHGLPVTVFRIAVAFSDEEALLLSNEELDRVLRGETIEIVEGKGRASIHVDDVVQAFLLATENGAAYGEVFNLVNAATYLSDRELYQLLIELTGSESRIEMKAKPAVVDLGLPSGGKAARVLGWKPARGREALERAIALDVRRMVAKGGPS